MDQMYLENIEEALEDEGKIVSYKWLSLHLKLPMNTAKQMLFEYLNAKKLEQPKLNATYLVSGITYDKNLDMDIQKICVVKEGHLDSVKSQMKSIYSIHVYSLQKCNIKDFNLIQASNNEKMMENLEDSTKYGHITFPNLKYRKQNIVEKHEQQQDKDVKPKDIVMKENIPASKPTKQAPLRKSTISSMFDQVKNIEAGKKPTPATKPVKLKGKNPLMGFMVKREPGTNSMSSFFKPKDIQKEDIEPEIKLEVEELPSDVSASPTKKNTASTSKDDSKAISSPNRKGNKPLSSSQKKKNDSKTAGKAQKRMSKPDTTSQAKRRRILQLDSSDSSSDEEISDGHDDVNNESPFPPVEELSPASNLDSDDDMIPATPQENTPISFCGKKKVGKMVDRTFTDDDGFLVTKSEYVCISDESDGESPIPMENLALVYGTEKTPERKTTATKSSPKKKNSPKKDTKRKSPKNPKPPLAKPKQASIMSFFMKK